MSNDLATASSEFPASLSPRAVIAMLTLQLRVAQQEAVDAERAAQDMHHVDEEVQLRDRLRTLLDERRAELDAEVARAHEEAAVTVAAAHRAARVMLSRATAAARPGSEPTAPPTVEAAAPPIVELLAPAIVAPAAAPIVAPAAELLVAPPPPLASPPASDVAPLDVQQVASVLANMLDERMAQWTPAPAPRKPSFWSHLFHVDVMIVVFLMIFCLVVVAAWMS